ncbi:hypothetical protein D3C86_2153920 [compost metagenome]
MAWLDRSNRSISSSNERVDRLFCDITDLLHQLPLGQQTVAQCPVFFPLGLDVALVVVPQDHGDRARTLLADLLDAD